MISGKLAEDIGSGTGFIAEGQVQKGLRVISVDQSGNMIKEMLKRAIKFSEIDYRLRTAEKNSNIRWYSRLCLCKYGSSSC